MPNLRISTSGVQSVDTSRIDQTEAFRRQEAMRREQLQQQAIAQQLQAQLAREGMAIQREGMGLQRELGMADIGARRDMPGLSADAALRQQGGTGMDMMQAQIGGQERLAHISNMPAMEQLRSQNTARMLENLMVLDQAWQSGSIPNQAEYDALRAQIIGGGQQQAQTMGSLVTDQDQPAQPRSVQIGAGARFNAPSASPMAAPAPVEPAPQQGMPQQTELTLKDAGAVAEQDALQAMINAKGRPQVFKDAMELLDMSRELSKGPALSDIQQASVDDMLLRVQEFSQINDKTMRSTMDFISDMAAKVASGDMTAQEQMTSTRQFYDRMESVAKLIDDIQQLTEQDPDRIAASGANLEGIMGSEDFASAETIHRLRSIRDSMRKVQKSPPNYPYRVPIMGSLIPSVYKALRDRGTTTETKRPL